MIDIVNKDVAYCKLVNRREVEITRQEMLAQFKSAGLEHYELTGIEVRKITYHHYENILDDKYINFQITLMGRTQFKIGYHINRNRYYVSTWRRKGDNKLEFLEHVCEGLDDTYFDSLCIKNVFELVKSFQAFKPIGDIIMAMKDAEKTE